MGAIIRFTHRDCRFRFDFHEGVGFYLCRQSSNARENMRSGNWGEYWKKKIEKYPDGTATIENAICHCPRCNKIYTEARIRFYIPKADKKYEYDERRPDSVSSVLLHDYFDLLEKETMICPDCKEEADVIEDYKKFQCPKCGKFLRGRYYGNWD